MLVRDMTPAPKLLLMHAYSSSGGGSSGSTANSGSTSTSSTSTTTSSTSTSSTSSTSTTSTTTNGPPVSAAQQLSRQGVYGLVYTYTAFSGIYSHPPPPQAAVAVGTVVVGAGVVGAGVVGGSSRGSKSSKSKSTTTATTSEVALLAPFMFMWDNDPSSAPWPAAVVAYGGEELWTQHFEYLLPFFRLETYIRIEGEPVLAIGHARRLGSKLQPMLELFTKLAQQHLQCGIYFMVTMGGDDTDTTTTATTSAATTAATTPTTPTSDANSFQSAEQDNTNIKATLHYSPPMHNTFPKEKLLPTNKNYKLLSQYWRLTAKNEVGSMLTSSMSAILHCPDVRRWEYVSENLIFVLMNDTQEVVSGSSGISTSSDTNTNIFKSSIHNAKDSIKDKEHQNKPSNYWLSSPSLFAKYPYFASDLMHTTRSITSCPHS
jgi:hypothetical protein